MKKSKMCSVWNESVKGQMHAHPPLDGDLKTEVVIVGGGMAGLLTAWKLKQAGVSCAVLEAKTAGSGVTGNTTAKITAQHGLIYSDLIKSSGLERAQVYYRSNTQAINCYRELNGRFPCDFEEKTAHVYSINDRNKLEREAEAYHKLGIAAHIGENPPLPFKTAGSLAMDKQAQFNPMKLVAALSKELKIYENTFARKIDGHTVITDKGKIQAKHIVLATHYPLVNIPGLYFIKMYQHRSYVIALENAPLIDGMYLDERKDGHSFRTYRNLQLIGGGDHKTGKEGGGFAELRGLAKSAYPQAEEKYRWATQDCMTLDSVPYIGKQRSGTDNLYVATGFNKWGMTGSMVAAELLCGLITRDKSELAALYAPDRSIWTKQLAVNAGAAVAGLASVGGPRCAHMGCKLHKNKVEGTWDCTCHGSRFDENGHVIDNPAKHGIRL